MVRFWRNAATLRATSTLLRRCNRKPSTTCLLMSTNLHLWSLKQVYLCLRKKLTLLWEITWKMNEHWHLSKRSCGKVQPKEGYWLMWGTNRWNNKSKKFMTKNMHQSNSKNSISLPATSTFLKFKLTKSWIFPSVSATTSWSKKRQKWEILKKMVKYFTIKGCITSIIDHSKVMTQNDERNPLQN